MVHLFTLVALAVWLVVFSPTSKEFAEFLFSKFGAKTDDGKF